MSFYSRNIGTGLPLATFENERFVEMWGVMGRVARSYHLKEVPLWIS
jgi:hypothetical protein